MMQPRIENAKVRLFNDKPPQRISARVSCGATENRTRDTRIFSPLLYQLSYGTIIFISFHEKFNLLLFLSFGITKVSIFSYTPNFSALFFDIFSFFSRNISEMIEN